MVVFLPYPGTLANDAVFCYTAVFDDLFSCSIFDAYCRLGLWSLCLWKYLFVARFGFFDVHVLFLMPSQDRVTSLP